MELFKLLHHLNPLLPGGKRLRARGRKGVREGKKKES